MNSLQGYDQLMLRLKAIGATKGPMKTVTVAVVGELRKNIPRKTSGTSRTILPQSVTETHATIEGSAVAKWLDSGTGLFGPKHHKIEPKVKKALAFYAGTFGPGGSLRLTGRPRKGAAGAGAQRVVVRSVKGMKARPYIQRSIHTVASNLGVDLIVKPWNDAA